MFTNQNQRQIPDECRGLLCVGCWMPLGEECAEKDALAGNLSALLAENPVLAAVRTDNLKVFGVGQHFGRRHLTKVGREVDLSARSIGTDALNGAELLSVTILVGLDIRTDDFAGTQECHKGHAGGADATLIICHNGSGVFQLVGDFTAPCGMHI